MISPFFNSRPYRHYTAVIMLPYQAHISPDTTYTETDSSSVGQGVHGEEFNVCLFMFFLFLNKQINKQYITRLETKLPGQFKKPIFGRYRNFTGSADLLSTNPTIYNIILWVDGTNDSLTKGLMFQVVLFIFFS